MTIEEIRTQVVLKLLDMEWQPQLALLEAARIMAFVETGRLAAEAEKPVATSEQ